MKPGPSLTEADAALIREKIREKYSQVAAASEGCCFRYPTGVAGLRRQGYPEDLLEDFPPALLDSFCGVGNPFSLGPINPGEKVLDIGCGTGLDVAVAARLTGPRGWVAGLDPTLAMIKKAGAYLSSQGSQNVGLLVGEAEHLPYAAGSFEVIISNGVFNLTLNKARALQEAHRVLKPGGRFLIADMVLMEALPPELASRVDNWHQ